MGHDYKCGFAKRFADDGDRDVKGWVGDIRWLQETGSWRYRPARCLASVWAVLIFVVTMIIVTPLEASAAFMERK